MSVILISPWSRKTTDGKPSPKNYPHWPEVVKGLADQGHVIVQVSCTGEADIPGAKRANDLSLSDLSLLVRNCLTWISVDNFFHHMAWTLGVPGIVLFGMSDPVIFGHPENVNLLKDRKYLRSRQFGLWSQEPENPKAFVGAEEVVAVVVETVKKKVGQGA